ncbi:MAG TPA: LysM domain-containing protein [Acidimicrobiales bacterium]|nr:LysM domain-containing protein [Acidimicrobiales bacterium]
MAAITIDSPRWRDGWGEPLSTPARPAPALRLVDSGDCRPDARVLRRRRLAVVVVLGLLLAVTLAVVSATLSRPAEAGSLPSGRQTHVVQPGDTYWSIAAATTDGGDLRVAVDELIDANGGRALFPGDRIELP